MDELKEPFARAAGSHEEPDVERALGGVRTRAYRRHRNQRLVAGAVAAAMFLGGGTAAWLALRPNAHPVPQESPTPGATTGGGLSALQASGVITYSDHVGLPQNPDYNLFSVTDDGSHLRTVLDLPEETLDPAWSPDGTRVAFVSFGNGSSDIFVANADGSDIQAVADTQGFAELQPAWSPDGTRIVYARTWEEADEGSGDGDVRHRRTHPMSNLYVTDLATGAESQLTDGDTPDHDPTWSPDGTTIVFDREPPQPVPPGTHPHIPLMALDVSSETITQLTDGPYDQDPDWSPDGSTIVFSGDVVGGDGRVLWAIAPDGTGRRQVTFGGDEGMPAWSPDGGSIAFVGAPATHETRYRGQALQTLDVATGGIDTIVDLIGIASRGIDWQPAPDLGDPGTPLMARVACEPDRIHVDDPVVVAQADGPHFLVANGTDGEVTFGDEPVAAGTEREVVLDAPPGSIEVSCSAGGTAGATTTVSVEDPRSFYAPVDVSCAGAPESVDYGDLGPVFGDDEPTFVVGRQFMEWPPRPSGGERPFVEWGRWPLAAVTGVRVVVGDAVVGAFRFAPEGGGWRLLNATWCGDSGIHPPAGPA